MKLSALAFTAYLSLSCSAFAAPVNINQASASEIASSLSGIGNSKAQAIVEYRKKHGKFKKAGDIVQVQGIGKSTWEKNKADIRIE